MGVLKKQDPPEVNVVNPNAGLVAPEGNAPISGEQIKAQERQKQEPPHQPPPEVHSVGHIDGRSVGKLAEGTFNFNNQNLDIKTSSELAFNLVVFSVRCMIKTYESTQKSFEKYWKGGLFMKVIRRWQS